LACCKEGLGEDAFSLYKKNAPAYIEDKSEIHMTEPYVYSQTIAGRSSAHYGRAKNSWLTGTASWSFVALSQGILGIIPTLDGLMINPCLPKEMKHIVIKRIYRNATYNIEINNENTGKYELKVDGKVINGKVIPIINKKTTYNVVVTK
jgi:cellobiose phosphorylase